MSTDTTLLDATELTAAFRSGQLTPTEVVADVLHRIARDGQAVNAFVTVTGESALEQARVAERRYASEDARDIPPLLGVPITVKDLEDTAGVRTTYGSVDYTDHVPTTDATIWGRLKAAGAILVGKTTTPELGASGVTECALTGITRNPWDHTRTAGGSSGGAAVAAACGFGPIATGSDGGGSIRVPASFCGVVGLKPTVGRIPFNDRDWAWEPVTTTGPLTRSVRDAALVLSITHGPDLYDPLSLLETGIDFTRGLQHPDVAGLRIAYSPNLGSGPVASDTAAVVRQAVGVFESDLGCIISPAQLDLPDPMQYFTDFWTPLIAAEQIHALVSGTVDQNALERFPMISAARSRSSLELAETMLITRTKISTAFADVFAHHDLLMWPTTPTTAHGHTGETGYPSTIEGVALAVPELDNQRLTEAISHAGCPAISVPAGWTAEGLPVGLQIAAARGREDLILRAAAAFEQARPWSWRYAQLLGSGQS